MVAMPATIHTPIMRPMGNASATCTAISPSRTAEISPRVKPSTRRLAKSRLRMDSATRALL